MGDSCNNWNNNIETNAEETRELFKNYSNNALFVKADISDEKAVINMYEQIEEKFGRLDGLVNNTVYYKIFSIEDLTAEEYRKELDVNVVARWMCIKYAIPLLKKSKMPRVVNIASRLGSRHMESSIAYCTSESATIIRKFDIKKHRTAKDG